MSRIEFVKQLSSGVLLSCVLAGLAPAVAGAQEAAPRPFLRKVIQLDDTQLAAVEKGDVVTFTSDSVDPDGKPLAKQEWDLDGDGRQALDTSFYFPIDVEFDPARGKRRAYRHRAAGLPLGAGNHPIRPPYEVSGGLLLLSCLRRLFPPATADQIVPQAAGRGAPRDQELAPEGHA
jgi:hypothetical protein